MDDVTVHIDELILAGYPWHEAVAASLRETRAEAALDRQTLDSVADRVAESLRTALPGQQP